MPPLVSILIPCYNSERWLADALRSALGQTWQNIEVIVVDDGSKDSTYNTARSFQCKNVKVVRQENQGACVARNTAYSLAQGNLIQYLDADDLLSPDKVEEQVRMLEFAEQDVLAVSPTIHFFDGEEPASGELHAGWPIVDSDNPVNWLIELMGPERGGMVQTGAWLTPRSIAERAGAWDESLWPTPMDDGEYFARVVLASKGIRRSKKGCNYYRKFRTGGNLSGQKAVDYRWGHFRSLCRIEENLKRHTADPRVNRAMARVFMDLAFVCYPCAKHVSDAALKRANSLGGGKRPQFGTLRGEILAKLFGWKTARWLNHYYHTRLKN